ncbi:exo-alpha-sialidase [Lysobacter auxotrophicus]|uniref:Exo-alpha-sialidase n=1 Tax=Lysobacter auxotrophicus TaxID=2992573 RepID=A0ABM8DDP3_9GAMM|nr:exo-alpha-sialidase [Lysobacter auxotrophicus]BDU16714.1 exo-alpha-sialidase [Lysobacter auxotrophicus]
MRRAPSPALCLLAASVLLCTGVAMADAPDEVVGEKLAPGIGYASAVKLAHQSNASDNGRLLLVYEPSEAGNVPLFESRDDGDSFKRVGSIDETAHRGDKSWALRWQPHLSELARSSGDLPAGTLLLAANAIRRDGGERITDQDLQLYASVDGGKSWTYRSSIVKGGGQPSDRLNKGVWEPYIVVLDDGRMVVFYSTEQHKARGFNQLLAHRVSTDGGRSWGKEVFDVALPGGVERPGMAIVERIPGRGYAMVYENIDNTGAAHNGQVHIKFSRDGLDWGDAADRGTPIQTASGAYPAACPTIRWLPGETPDGVIVVAAQRAGGGGDAGGRTFYWNADGGRGPWWEAGAPVRKRTGNIHAGWTQALIPREDGKLLHVTSSSTANAPAPDETNEILFAAAPLALDRYEAEDAVRRGGAQIDNVDASAYRKVRLASGEDADLTFDVVIGEAGPRTLTVRFADIGFAAAPRLRVNGDIASGGVQPSTSEGWREATFTASLKSGHNRLVLTNPDRPLDYDWLQVGAPTRGVASP